MLVAWSARNHQPDPPPLDRPGLQHVLTRAIVIRRIAADTRRRGRSPKAATHLGRTANLGAGPAAVAARTRRPFLLVCALNARRLSRPTGAADHAARRARVAQVLHQRDADLEGLISSGRSDVSLVIYRLRRLVARRAGIASETIVSGGSRRSAASHAGGGRCGVGNRRRYHAFLLLNAWSATSG